MRLDVIEIGTSDFRTEIQSPGAKNKTGVVVEPCSVYLNRLPNLKTWQKKQIAISDEFGEIEMYFISPETIAKEKFPNWFRGCNSMNEIHKTVESWFKKNGYDLFSQYISKEVVKVVPFKQFIFDLNVEEIGFLKIDTEGHDCVIMREYLDLIEHRSYYKAEKIQFEANELSDPQEVASISKSLMNHGYKITKTKTDVIAEL